MEGASFVIRIAIPRRLIQRFKEIDSLTKEMVRYYLGIVSQANSDGVIVDFKKHYTILKIMKTYEEGTCSKSTFYNAHKRLIEAGLIMEFMGNLVIVDYDYLFKKKQGGFIVLPEVIFKKMFKNLEWAAIKLFFDWVLKLNNDKNNKFIFFSVKKELQKNMNNLHKRFTCEIINLIEQLKQIFKIIEIQDGVFSVAILWKFLVLKKDRTYNTQDILDKYKRKAEMIKEILESKEHIKYTVDDLVDFVRIFKRTSRRMIEKAFKILNKRLYYKEQRNETIDSLGKYLRGIVKAEFKTLDI